jgi:hypothetical protein
MKRIGATFLFVPSGAVVLAVAACGGASTTSPSSSDSGSVPAGADGCRPLDGTYTETTTLASGDPATCAPDTTSVVTWGGDAGPPADAGVPVANVCSCDGSTRTCQATMEFTFFTTTITTTTVYSATGWTDTSEEESTWADGGVMTGPCTYAGVATKT